MAIFDSYSAAFLFTFSSSFILLLASSSSLQVIFNSLFSLAIVPADSLKFYWAVLTSSPRLVFSFRSLLIFCLQVSDSWLLVANLPLQSFSSLLSFDIWLADKRRFSCAFLTSSPKCWFYWISPCNFLLMPSFSASFCSMRFLYYCSSVNAFDC